MKLYKLWILSALVGLATAGFLGLGCGSCSSGDDDDVCGDGKVNQAEGIELCDGATPEACTVGLYTGEKICLSEQTTPDCTGYGTCDIGAKECGNGEKEDLETCDSDSQACDDGCYDGEKACKSDCTGYATACDIAAQDCGNGTKEGCETCDDGDNDNCTAACNANCTGAGGSVCGDGAKTCAETCDDGDTDNCVGACNEDCSGPSNTCGDGVVACGEVCDSGAAADNCNPAVCNTTCSGNGVAPVCGDGAATCGEDCDDGNGTNCDDCNNECHPVGNLCGNGQLDCAEVCDDGSLNGQYANPANCNLTCTDPVGGPHCGDGIVNGGEECDGTDHCNAQCETFTGPPEGPVAIVWATVDTVTGDVTLHWTRAVIDGVPAASYSVVRAIGVNGSTLDTGVTDTTFVDLDILPDCSNGVGCQYTIVDSNGHISNILFVKGYQPDVCGNGILDAGEECDLGSAGNIAQYGCTNGCTLISGTCGNGTLEAGEECDGTQSAIAMPTHGICQTYCQAPGDCASTCKISCETGFDLNELGVCVATSGQP